MGKRRNQPLDSDSSSEDGSDLDSVIICGIFFRIIYNHHNGNVEITDESCIFSIDFDKVLYKKNFHFGVVVFLKIAHFVYCLFT